MKVDEGTGDRAPSLGETATASAAVRRINVAAADSRVGVLSRVK